MSRVRAIRRNVSASRVTPASYIDGGEGGEGGDEDLYSVGTEPAKSYADAAVTSPPPCRTSPPSQLRTRARERIPPRDAARPAATRFLTHVQ